MGEGKARRPSFLPGSEWRRNAAIAHLDRVQRREGL